MIFSSFFLNVLKLLYVSVKLIGHWQNISQIENYCREFRCICWDILLSRPLLSDDCQTRAYLQSPYWSPYKDPEFLRSSQQTKWLEFSDLAFIMRWEVSSAGDSSDELTWSWWRQDSWCRHSPAPGCPGCSGRSASPDSSLDQWMITVVRMWAADLCLAGSWLEPAVAACPGGHRERGRWGRPPSDRAPGSFSPDLLAWSPRSFSSAGGWRGRTRAAAPRSPCGKLKE